MALKHFIVNLLCIFVYINYGLAEPIFYYDGNPATVKRTTTATPYHRSTVVSTNVTSNRISAKPSIAIVSTTELPEVKTSSASPASTAKPAAKYVGDLTFEEAYKLVKYPVLINVTDDDLGIKYNEYGFSHFNDTTEINLSLIKMFLDHLVTKDVVLRNMATHSLARVAGKEKYDYLVYIITAVEPSVTYRKLKEEISLYTTAAARLNLNAYGFKFSSGRASEFLSAGNVYRGLILLFDSIEV